MLDRAEDWAGFQAAVDAFDSPSQNIVYADVDGNIGYALNGRLPVRSSGDGTVPSAGGTGAAWMEGGPRPVLPRVLNPESGFIASSNNEIDRGAGAIITRDWAAPYRAARLTEVLGSAKGLSLDAMATLQGDITSLAAARVLGGVKQALTTATAKKADDSAGLALTELAAWNHVVDARPVVTLYEAFEDALWRRTFVDEMGSRFFSPSTDGLEASGRPDCTQSSMSGSRDGSTTSPRWTRAKPVMTSSSWPRETPPSACRPTSAAAAAGPGIASTPSSFDHPLGQGSWLLSWLFNRGPVPVIGDGTTVMRVS